MACYHPVPAYQHRKGEGAGVGTPLRLGKNIIPNLQVPCGHCLGCRQSRANQWAQRCTHEARLTRDNVFVTLTYNAEALPFAAHLERKEISLFIKRLRKHVARRSRGVATDTNRPIRYFGCGEYGEGKERPHYHVILFNCTFDDAERIEDSGEHKQWQSATLTRIWGRGRATFGLFTEAAANYIAKYTLKKQNAKEAFKDNTDMACNADGEWIPREQPYLRMSLKPGIGAEWLEQYHNDLQHGYLVTKGGHLTSPPRAYLTRLRKTHPELYVRIQQQRREHAEKHMGDKNEGARLEAAEKIHKTRKQLTDRRKL